MGWSGSGCGSDDSCTPESMASPGEEAELAVTLQGLPDVGPDFVYEGWLVTAGGAVSSGRFSIGAHGETHTFDIDSGLARCSPLFVLTIEPAVGDDPAPAETHVVAGAFDDQGVAALRADHPKALGTNFASAKGGYILETPTTPDIEDDYGQGVWFLEPDSGQPSLDLPDLPEGWTYEGWVVGPDGPISTGRFSDPAQLDSDGAGPAAGTGGFPSLPGQDFIDPARLLTDGYAVVITIEPEPDVSPGPFTIKPLVDDEVEDVGRGGFQTLTNKAADALPTGIATLK